MNKELQEIEQELFAINKEKRAIEQKLIAIIMVAISETIKECPVKRLGSGCFVIRCSDLIGNTWNPEFYDLYKIPISRKFIMKIIEKL